MPVVLYSNAPSFRAEVDALRQEENERLFGRMTYANLSELSAFASSVDPRLPIPPALARLSAEMAGCAYTLDFNRWQRAGWEDATFVIEDHVIVLDRDDHSRIATLESELRRRRARSMISGVRIISDVRRAAQNLVAPRMNKAVVVAHALPEGRAVVAISFIGTTTKLYDWFTNFRFSAEGGLHSGFLELARLFAAQAANVALPDLAKLMGKETLTLSDVLAEAAKADSRFILWITGHSQGGAVAQIYAHMLLEGGVLAANLRVCTLAAPSVAMEGAVKAPSQYPIQNLINADDVVPRVGSQVRLGIDHVYHPDDAFRARHYGLEEEHGGAFERVAHATKQVRSTRDALCWGAAVARMFCDMETDGELEALFSTLVPHLSVLGRMSVGAADFARYMTGVLENSHQSLLGEMPDAEHVARYEELMRGLLRELGAKSLAKALMTCLLMPHRIASEKEEDPLPAYVAIVRRHLHEVVIQTDEAPAIPPSDIRALPPPDDEGAHEDEP